MLLEVGQESDGVLTKSQSSKYECRTYFDQASLAIDIKDDINHTNYVLTNMFSWLRSYIFSLKIGVFRAILQSLFRAQWLVAIGNLDFLDIYTHEIEANDVVSASDQRVN